MNGINLQYECTIALLQNKIESHANQLKSQQSTIEALRLENALLKLYQPHKTTNMGNSSLTVISQPINTVDTSTKYENDSKSPSNSSNAVDKFSEMLSSLSLSGKAANHT
jgi:hypothetical protein